MHCSLEDKNQSLINKRIEKAFCHLNRRFIFVRQDIKTPICAENLISKRNEVQILITV